jgi:hypothetical protein
MKKNAPYAEVSKKTNIFTTLYKYYVKQIWLQYFIILDTLHNKQSESLMHIALSTVLHSEQQCVIPGHFQLNA